jgi:Fe-S-cluster-containing dehydrogenase component
VDVTRRRLLHLIGASASLAGGAACSRGAMRDIVPYVNQPPEVTPAVPTFYATTMSIDGYGVGMLVESHEGRPTKAEGNPHHPASLGSLGAIGQASVLSLYDPTRAALLTRGGVPATFRAFADAAAAPPARGRHIHLLLEPTSAPHLADLVARVRARGDIVVHFDAPLGRSAVWDGARLAFGQVLEPRFDFTQADVVLSLDADFLGAATTPLPWARAWAERRRVQGPSAAMSRLYAVEGRLSVTGMAADERLRAQPREMVAIAADLLAAVLALGPADAPAEVRRAAAARPRGSHRPWIDAAAHDLHARAGAGLVVAGDGQPAPVHALAHATNHVLGAVGRTVVYGPSAVFEAGEDSHRLEGLVRAIDAGDVATLVIVGGDPVYTAPADLELARRVRTVPQRAYVGLYDNETSKQCEWRVPQAHFLESWGDARAFDGSPSIAQPLIRALVEGKTAAQVLAAFVGQPDATSRDLVEAHWRAHAPRRFDEFWQRALVVGVVEHEATPPVEARLDWDAVAKVLAAPAPAATGLAIAYFADSKVYDGRFAENPWLQELADPVTKLTWDNAALLSAATAAREGLENEDVVELEVRGRALRAPVLVVPGMADDLVAIALGYGQESPDRISHGAGANAYRLRDSRAPWFDGATLRKVPGTWSLARTQEHWTLEGRPVALSTTLADYRKSPDFAEAHNEPARSLYFLSPRGPHQWGMTIDLNACTGCSACVVACMAENNVPVVGKSGVRLGREMHWLRIDRYYEGDPRDPTVLVQPMLCQHCEKAPCEYVCPVNATVHSDDGLNEMVYNRCVGTRFCSNNCPYKVRRFNFFNYNAGKDQSLRLAMNPDVTVRARGVMEKCTYCVQRIREAEIRARREDRALKDGEVVTACQGTCPTGAIVFGDIADPATLVSQSRRNDRLYEALHELGTVPRTRYLARVTNPNPDLVRR